MVMLKPYNSKIGKLSKDELQLIIDRCSSLSQVLISLGLRGVGGNYKTLRDYISYHGISLDKLTSNANSNYLNQLNKIDMSTPIEDILISCKNNSMAKKYIIARGALEYRCSKCPIIDTYNGEPIVLHLDHIDGNHSDYSLSNLRFLCPNCHSQTSTYTGRNIRIKNRVAKKLPVTKSTLEKIEKRCECGKIMNVKSDRCISCYKESVYDNAKLKIDPLILSELVKTNSLVSIGKTYGVSDNAIKKRCIKLGITIPTKASNQEKRP